MSQKLEAALDAVVYERTRSALAELLDTIQHSEVSGSNEHFSRIIGEHLSQYGVIGMKWGVRKDRSGRSRRGTRDKDSDKKRAKTKDTPKSEGNNSRQNERLSDEELRKIVDRIQLEQRYASLTSAQKASPSRVQTLIKDVAYDVTKGAATEVGKLILSQALKVQFNKVAGADFKIPVKDLKKAMGG